MLGPNVRCAGPRLEVHWGIKVHVRMYSNRLYKIYKARMVGLFTVNIRNTPGSL